MENMFFGGALTVYTEKLLSAEGIDTKEKLENMSDVGLLNIPGFGPKSLHDVDSFLGRIPLKTQRKIDAAKRYLEKQGFRVEKI